MKARRIFSGLAKGGSLFLFIYLVVFPQSATEPTRAALRFCALTLVPALFIYLVLSRLIMASPIINRLNSVLGLEAITLLLGTLCGCPVGAKTAVSLYDNGRISKKQGEYLCSFSNNASLSFVIGFVGTEILGDLRKGILLLIFQLVASAVTAAVMRYAIFGKGGFGRVSANITVKTSLWQAVSDSTSTVVRLCGCVVFFMVAGGVFSGLLALSPVGDAILKSTLEFSSGCAAAGNTGRLAFIICAFALGQTGGSVALQVKSVVGSRFSLRPYIAGKLISCGVMTSLAIIFG